MGTRYTTKTATGYNASPPPDDGSTTAANQITWAKHKTKLADPIKTLTDAVNTALVAQFDEGPDAKATGYTADADDYKKTLECNGTFTVTLPDAATIGAGYEVTVKNVGSGTITVAPTTTADGIDGEASVALSANRLLRVVVNEGASAYLSMTTAIGTDIGDIVELEDVSGAAGLPAVDGSQLTNINGRTRFLLRAEAPSGAASIVWDSALWFSSSFVSWRIEFESVLPATDAVSFYLQFSTDGGSTYLTGAITNIGGGKNSDTSEFDLTSTSQDQISICADIRNTDGYVGGYVDLFGLRDGNEAKAVTQAVWRRSNSFTAGNSIWSVISTASPINAMRLLMSSGNITSGTLRFYGMT